MSRFWSVSFPLMYRVLALLDPPIRAVWRRFGIGNVVELRVARRNGGGTRSRLVGVLRAHDRMYVGHPNGHVGWTRDLEADGSAQMAWPREAPIDVTAEQLSDGEERDAAIRSTSQHPFPGNVVYRLARRHVMAAGVYFRMRAEVESYRR